MVLTASKGDNDERVTALRDSNGSWIMVYTPTGQPFTIDMSGLNGHNIKASWFNPCNGKYTTFSMDGVKGSGKMKTFSPPKESSHTDWTLVLESK
jgi:hypothetical protein